MTWIEPEFHDSPPNVVEFIVAPSLLVDLALLLIEGFANLGAERVRQTAPLLFAVDPLAQLIDAPVPVGGVANLGPLHPASVKFSHQRELRKERHAGKLLLEATAEIDRLIGICTHVHDRMLRGNSDMELMAKLAEGWRGPNNKISEEAGRKE